MASGKRASMREGPLAELFRKTEQAAEQAETPRHGRRRGPRPRAVRRPAGQERRAPEPPPPHPRETGYPHPSLGATPDAPPTPEPRVPTPQERLRHAFSSDIPENILEPPARAGSDRRPRSVLARRRRADARGAPPSRSASP